MGFIKKGKKKVYFPHNILFLERERERSKKSKKKIKILKILKIPINIFLV